MKFSIKDFFNKNDRICSSPRIWSSLLNKSITENFIFVSLFITNIQCVHLSLAYKMCGREVCSVDYIDTVSVLYSVTRNPTIFDSEARRNRN